jgi:allophanate hydrolase
MTIKLAVVGAHLRGQPLNHQLSDRHADFIEQTTTEAAYRLYALANTTPPKPGLRRVAQGGAEIEVEIWSLTAEAFGSFVAAIPQPLGIGTVTLASGEVVKGFICEEIGYEGAEDITSHGGWRQYLASR